jgi:antitoxin (DNA-binding transcriptional repressor) of toxin-antitoxin stability system
VPSDDRTGPPFGADLSFSHTFDYDCAPARGRQVPLSEIVSRVHDHHERVTVTVHGRPSAVLIAPEEPSAPAGGAQSAPTMTINPVAGAQSLTSLATQPYDRDGQSPDACRSPFRHGFALSLA